MMADDDDDDDDDAWPLIFHDFRPPGLKANNPRPAHNPRYHTSGNTAVRT